MQGDTNGWEMLRACVCVCVCVCVCTQRHGYPDASCFGHALEGNLHLVFAQVRACSAEQGAAGDPGKRLLWACLCVPRAPAFLEQLPRHLGLPCAPAYPANLSA